MIGARTSEVAIQTPEGVRFSLALAGFSARFAAWLIDFLIVIAAASTLGKLLSVFQFISVDIARALTLIAYFAISIGYGVFFEWRWHGQTVGKRVMHLRVVDAQGLQLQFSQILVRNLLRFVDLLPALYLVGGAAVLFTRDAQRLGDMAANTIVIRQRSAQEYLAVHLRYGRFNSLLENLTMAARLRQKADPELVAIAYEAVMRREELDPVARVEVFRHAAKELRALVPFPDALTEGMTDEQYVRAALEVIYSTTQRH